MDDNHVIQGPWSGDKAEETADVREFIECIDRLWTLDPERIACALIEAGKTSETTGLRLELSLTRAKSIVERIEQASRRLNMGTTTQKRSVIERLLQAEPSSPSDLPA